MTDPSLLPTSRPVLLLLPATHPDLVFALNDGGRAEAGFRGSTGDCVVRAIAIAANLPYRDVYDALAERGIIPSRGVDCGGVTGPAPAPPATAPGGAGTPSGEDDDESDIAPRGRLAGSYARESR